MEQPYSETNAGLHYDLRLEINPPTHSLSVSGSVVYHSPVHHLERARFYLHRQFSIQSLNGKRVLGYHHKPDSMPQEGILPQASVLDVYFDPPLSQREAALIQFEYQGQIPGWPDDSASAISEDWVELGNNLPWFPIQYDDSPSNLTFTLKVICPPDYQVSSYGRYAYQDGAWFFNWPHPTTDIVVVAGRSLNLQQFESEPNRVFVSSATFSEAAMNQLGEDLLWTMERFSGWFGPTRPGEFTLIESPRLQGGSYARRGLVVINGVNEHDYLNQREAYVRFLAHEVAHAWWWEAPTSSWEDWLNESLAEYSALLAVRERFGLEKFELFLKRKRERVTETRPLWEFDRTDLSTPEKISLVERMLYDQGPLLLNNLTQRIGNQRFLELCRAMLWSGVTHTSHLLDLVEELEDTETRRWMEEQLRDSSIIR